MPPASKKKNRWPLYLGLALLGVAALCLSLVDIRPLLETVLPGLRLNKTTFVNLIRSLGPWGPLGSIALMLAHSFVPFPAEFLTVANGMVFGPVWGVVITWLGSMLAALASFGLTRHYGRPFVARNISGAQLEKLDQWIRHQGAMSLLLSRLIPLISFNLVNYGAGLTGVSWWTFTWTTGIGILPMTVIMVLMGNNFHALPWWTWSLLLGAIIGTTYGVSVLHKKKRRRQTGTDSLLPLAKSE